MNIANPHEPAPVASPAPGRRTYYPAFGLGIFPDYRAALSAIGFPPDEAAGWIAAHSGTAATMKNNDAPAVQVLIEPAAAGGARVSYLFGEGFAEPDRAAAWMAEFMASGVPSRGAAFRWGVICRTRGALQ